MNNPIAKIFWLSLLAICLAGELAFASGADNPLLFMLDANEFEWRDTADGDAFVWRGEAWLGKDRDKALLKSRGEATKDATEEFELQLLYSRAIDRDGTLEVGWRGAVQPGVQRDGLAIGVPGVAP